MLDFEFELLSRECCDDFLSVIFALKSTLAGCVKIESSSRGLAITCGNTLLTRRYLVIGGWLDSSVALLFSELSFDRVVKPRRMSLMRPKISKGPPPDIASAGTSGVLAALAV